MSRSRLCLAAIAAFLLGIMLLATDLANTPAHADTPTCVTKPEYKAVDKGWTRARTHRVFDTDGWVFSWHDGIRTRIYLPCGDWSPSVFVFYRYRDGAWRVAGKLR